MADVNPIIPAGQPAFDVRNKVMSIGDGETAWNDLPKVGVPYPPSDGNVYVMVNGQWAKLSWDDITIEIPPSITSALDVSIELGQTLNYTITASNAEDATFSVSNMPEGMTYDDNSHTVTWAVPDDADWTKIHRFTATVTSDVGTDQKAINIVLVVPEAWKPKITPNQVITLAVGQEMSPYQILGQNITVTAVEGTNENEENAG